jgi:uncharacterized membrane protein YfcA
MCGRVGGDEHAWPYVYKLLLASIPAALIGVLFKDWFEARFNDPAFSATMVMVSGCVVWSIRWASERARFTLSGFLPIGLSAAITLLAGTLIPFLIVMGVMAMILGLARATTLRQWHAQPTWVAVKMCSFQYLSFPAPHSTPMSQKPEGFRAGIGFAYC